MCIFCWLIYFPVYIIGVGPDYGNTTSARVNATYEYLIVTDANRLALMVFARDPLTFFQNYNKQVMEFLQKNGFGGSVFWNNPQALYQVLHTLPVITTIRI